MKPHDLSGESVNSCESLVWAKGTEPCLFVVFLHALRK